MSSTLGAAVPLLSKVQSAGQWSALLAGVWAADSVDAAEQIRDQLAAHETVITPEGVWLGRNWLYSQQSHDAQASVLAREKEIDKVAKQLTSLDAEVAQLSEELDGKRDALRNAENRRDDWQRRVNEYRQQASEIQSQFGGRQARLDSLIAQQQRIGEECAELREQIKNDLQMQDETRDKLHEALEAMDQLADERETLNQQRDVLQEAVAQARDQWHNTKDARHQVEVQLQAAKTDHARLLQGMERLEERVEQLREQLHDLQQTLEKQVDPLGTLKAELDQFQEQRATVEESLRQARQTVEHLDEALSDYEEQRHKLESRSSELRMLLEQTKMEAQGDEVRRQTIEEQLQQVQLPLPEDQRGEDGATTYTPTPLTLLAEMPEHADEAGWVAQIESTQRKLERIGSVNMAALEEYEEQLQRKTYLDEQADDVNQALELLNNAIKTIDRETRMRFKATLDTVNANLQAMFPKLFGGGEAYLDVTGDDLLKAGVSIMARPPGKRNSTIHLLSGGEKALTAISLVFAIFEINPAPFCMLDEVDAPLDDTNVGRFCALLSAMSEHVQFIFITHNKITMEIAHQLVGVTQQEPGVSRPVTVDVSEAVEMVGV